MISQHHTVPDHRISSNNMISLKIIIFHCIGITFASCHILKNGKLCLHGHEKHVPEFLTGTKPFFPLFKLPFIQQGTNLFYKPQFMNPGTVIQPAVPLQSWPIISEKPQVIFEEPQHIPPAPVIIAEPVEIKPQPPEVASITISQPKPVEIPEAPVLPPLSIPEQPPVIIPVNTNEQILEDQPILVPEPFEIPEAPQLPPFTIFDEPSPIVPAVPVNCEVHSSPDQKPIVIPAGPTLPPFSETEIQPVIISAAPENSEIILVEPTPEHKPIEIPEAPLLPPLPELPPIVIPVSSSPENPECDEQPETPSLPSLPVPDAPVVVEVEPPSEWIPIKLPEAPILPAFTMPELPPIIVPITSEIIEVHPEYKPIDIPEAPVLPPIVIPQVQPVPDCDDQPISEHKPIAEYKPIQIPEAPILPAFTMPELPPVPIAPENPEVIEVHPSPEYKPIEIPEAPVLPAFTMPELPPVVIPITPENLELIEVHPIPEHKPTAIPEAPIIIPELQPIPDCDDQPASDGKPIQIPDAPLLPSLSPSVIIPVEPSFPVMNPTEIVGQQNPDCVDEPGTGQKLMEIPEAPVLPPFIVPEVPLITNIPQVPSFIEIDSAPEFKPVEIPAAPVLPPFSLPEITNNAVSDCNDQPESQALLIPDGPTLPPMTEIIEPVEIVTPTDSDCPPAENGLENEPEPVINHLEIPPPPKIPSNIQNPTIIEYQPLPAIPEAPKIPIFNLPHIPSKTIEFGPIQVVEKLKNIPPVPILPEYEVQETESGRPLPPAQEISQATISTMQPIVVDSSEEPCRDEKPIYQEIIQPTFWAQNIIIERVLPNMIISDKEEAKSFAAGIKYPVRTKPYFV